MDPTDDELLAELAAAVREAGEVPPGLIRFGQAAFAWHDLDSELARLVSESQPAGVRSTAAPLRTLVFAGAGLTIEIALHQDAVRGQLAPAGPGTVQVRASHPEPPRDVAVDEDGWFVIAPAPAGPFRLSVTAAGRTVLTEWISPS